MADDAPDLSLSLSLSLPRERFSFFFNRSNRRLSFSFFRSNERGETRSDRDDVLKGRFFLARWLTD